MGKVKRLTVILFIAFLAGVFLAFGVWLWARGCGGSSPAPALGSKPKGTPPGWTAAPAETTPLVENPFKPSTAGKKTKPLPAGSSVIEVPPSTTPTLIGILPGGEVIVPQGVEGVVVYKKRLPLMALECRPWLGAGVEGHAAGIAPAAAVGLDVVRVGRVHGGPGGLASPRNVAALITGGVEIWRNVDGRVGGGFGTAGATAFAGVDIAIE
jgi:hypothetical protein